MQIKDLSKDLPGGPVVRNPPCNAADSGLISSLGGFPMLQGNWARVLQLLSLHSRAFALQPLSPSTLETMFRNKRCHFNKTAHCSQRVAPTRCN